MNIIAELYDFAHKISRLLRGWRLCHYRECGKWVRRPHQFKGHPFCDRLCAARWAHGVILFPDLERHAREGGAV
jgi:hypothetical protein